MRTRRIHARRAVAMLLVLISLMLATILTTSYLASRDNSSAIGENVAGAAAARWAADAGLAMGLAILQTETNWRGAADGNLAVNHPFGPGTISLTAKDLETGFAPGPNTRYVELTSTANVDGVSQSCAAQVYVPVPALYGADIDLSEFAIFGSERVTFSGSATVARWQMAPLSKLGSPIAVGTRNSSAGSVVLQNDAVVIDGHVYGPPDASNSLVSSNGTLLQVTKLPAQMPMPAPPPTNVAPPDDSGGGLIGSLLGVVLDLLGINSTVSSDGRYDEMSLEDNSTLTLQGNIQQVSDTDLRMRDSKIRVNGIVKIVVFDDLIMERSAIELMPGARLTMYVGDQVVINDSYIGQSRTNTLRDTSGMERHFDTQRVRILRLPTATSGTNWDVINRSAIKATLYAPLTRLRIGGQSALYGRAVAREVEIIETASVFYDPALNIQMGFTSPTSPIYNIDGTVKDDFKTLGTFDPATLQAMADSTDTRIIMPDQAVLIKPADDVDAVPDLGEVHEPTPRPVQIAHQWSYFGSGVSSWE